MQTTDATSPGRAYWILSGLLLVWALGYTWLVITVLFVATPEYFEALVTAGTILPGYSDYVQHLPLWVIVLLCLKAATRLGGAVALVLRSRHAFTLFAWSLVLVLIIFMRGFLFHNVGSVERPLQLALEFFFFGLSIFAVWYAARCGLRGLLR
jgi:hypothetical protein